MPSNRSEPASLPARRGLGGLLTLARLLVAGQFRLKRRGPGVGGVHVVFGETILAPQPPAAPPPPPARPSRTLGPADQAVHDDLAAALAQVAERHAIFRHLVFLERQIGRAGLGGLSGLPVEVLAKAFDQLSLLTVAHEGKGLVELKTRLSRLLVAKGHRAHLLADDHASPSDFLQHAQPAVAEGRLSDFLIAAGEPAAPGR